MKKTANSEPLRLTRRQLLSLMGLGSLCCGSLHPISLLARNLVDGLIADAQAQSGFQTKKYVSILYPGAPIRWVWDGFLNPGNETIVPNAAVQNWLVQNTYNPADPTNTTYRAELVTLPNNSSIYLAPLWNRNIPVSTGGSVQMKSLLNNTLIMRGVDVQADAGHVLGPARTIYPLGASASLTGLVADAHPETPLPAVGFLGNHNYMDPFFQGYRSLRGISPTLVNSSNNALENTLSPFIVSDAGTLANLTKLNSAPVQAAISNAMTELGNYAKSSMPGSDVLYQNYDSARNLFQTSFGDLRNVVYPALYNKYQNLAALCAHTAIPNILPNSGASGSGYDLASNNFFSEIAWQFAVAEYLLVNGLSSSISICSGGAAGVAGLGNFNDEHTEGNRQKSLICHSYQFLLLSAMLYEFRRVLIANNLWNDTVVHITSEYGRSPQNTGGGSDHAPAAGVVTIMSGAITRPTFIGNIKYDSQPGGLYQGTNGDAAPVQTQSGTRIITNNIAASTVASILGVQNPLTQSSSIVAVDPSGIGVTSLAEAPRNI